MARKATRSSIRKHSKSKETQVAAFFKTKRTPLSGSNSGHHTSSDSLSEHFYVEQKHRAEHAAFSLWLETRDKAKKEGKIPVVTLSQQGQRGFLICVNSNDMVDFARELLRLHGDVVLTAPRSAPSRHR